MSEQECKNGCTIPPAFPRRPGESPPSLHGNGCFCCSPNDRLSVDNRPALPHFNYRIGSYGTIREWMFDRLNQTPNLLNWTHRAPDDPAVALIEGAAILGDILTFYQDTYANEAYLRTAQWRENITELVRLLGYRLSPAVGGNATFAFEIKKDEAVTIPVGFPVKATMETTGKPADFETLAEITAYPWLSRFKLFRPLDTPDITKQTTEFYISMPEQLLSPIELKVGDRLIVGESDQGGLTQPKQFKNAEIVTVDSVRELHGQKIYKIKGKMKRPAPIGALTAYRLGRTFHHFGKNNLDGTGGSTNAAQYSKMIDPSEPITSTAEVNGKKTTTTSTIPTRLVPLFKSLFAGVSDVSINPRMTNLEIPLDIEVPDLVPNTPMVFDFGVLNQFSFNYLPHFSLVRTVTDIRSMAMTWGVESGTVSLITIAESLNSSIRHPNFPNLELFSWMLIADALFHEVTSPFFKIRHVKTEVPVSKGYTASFYGTAEQAKTLNGRRVMLEKPGAEPQVLSVANIQVNPPAGTEALSQLHTITLSDKLDYTDFPNENPFVTVYGNLVDADEGKTLPEEVLGSGDATLIFQNFKLPKAPLTYHIVSENTPPETPETEIYVDGRLWHPVDTFFGRGSDEHIYIIREDTAGNSWVQFGDGKTGARLSTGTKNVTASYRTGTGSHGPLQADTKVQAGAKIKNLDKVQMPMDATGGSPPEDGNNARSAAPGKVQSLGRIVSLRDFEFEAAAIPGVASAAASWSLVDNIPSVVITVLMETGRSKEIDAVRATLNSYNDLRGAGRNPVVVLAGKRLYVTVSVQYGLNAEFRADLVETEIRRALGVNFGLATLEEDQTGLFSLRRRRLDAREYASSIEGYVQNVEGVVWAKATAFAAISASDDPAAITPPPVAVLDPIVACDPGHVLSLYDKHLFLMNSAGGAG